MSSTKLIFTYKRKRLSSCSGGGHTGVCPGFALDVQAGKHYDATKEKSESMEKDPVISKCEDPNDVDQSMDFKSGAEPSGHQGTESDFQHNCHEKQLSPLSSPERKTSSVVKEKYVRRCSMPNSKTMPHCSQELSETSGLETTNPIDKELHSHLDTSCTQALSQSVEGSSVQERYLSSVEAVKAKLTAPLLTFSRRLKRKADVDELPDKGGAAAMRDCMGVPACVGEGATENPRPLEKSDMTVANNCTNTRNLPCKGSEEMTSKEIGDSSCRHAISCPETSVSRQIKGKSSSCEGEAFIGNASFVAEQSAVKTSGPVTAVVPGSDDLETKNYLKSVVVQTSKDVALSSCEDSSKSDELRILSQCQAFSGDSSQLTSSDSAYVKTDAGEMIEHKASSVSLDPSCPPSGACVIDCNVIPEPELQEKESDFKGSVAMVKNDEKDMQVDYPKSRGLKLFGATDVQAVESASSHVVQSPSDVHTRLGVDEKHEAKCLQLFSENGLSAPASTPSEAVCSRNQQNAIFTLKSGKARMEQASSKASDILSLSLAREPISRVQTSKLGSGGKLLQDRDIRNREFIQDPVFQPFLDQSSLTSRHKVMFESCSAKATALRGNRNISLDRFDSCPTIWSEEELDSLWIGIRRHGRGNWHAILLDPKLRFAPWRVARDLADQWERELNKLLCRQPTPAGSCLKPPESHNMDSNGRFMDPRVGLVRNNTSAETQLSLGDLFAQTEGRFFTSNGHNWPHNHVTVASREGICSYSSFNAVQTSVMIGNGLLEGQAKGLAANTHVPHWLRQPVGTPSKPIEYPPQMSTLPQMGGLHFKHPFPETSGTSSRRRKLISNKFQGSAAVEKQPHSGSPFGGCIKREQTTDNVIVIDSDASSEETISDDHNN